MVSQFCGDPDRLSVMQPVDNGIYAVYRDGLYLGVVGREELGRCLPW